MTASVLLLLIGLVDIVRSGRSPGRAWAATGAVLVTVGALAGVGLGISPWRVLGCLLLTIGWATVMPTSPTARLRMWPAVALLTVVVWTTLTTPASSGSAPSGSPGFLLSAYERVTHPALDSVTPATVLAALAVLVVLTQSANIITRAAIGLVQPQDGTRRAVSGDPHPGAATPIDSGSSTATAPDTAPATTAADTGSSWDLRIGRRRLASLDRRQAPSDVAAPVSPLKGGRLIGPLERYLIVAATLAGAYPVIAGLLAAKGIVRFPEISADRGVGSAAETFLIGSLTSWTISAAAVLYLIGTSTL